jgi:cytochrome c oxidase assembly protein subunit 15
MAAARGALPPLSQADWRALFAKYRETPQFQKCSPRSAWKDSRAFSGGNTRTGCWGAIDWTWFFFCRFLYFLFKKKVSKTLSWKLAGLFVLGGLQGALGWYMVQSGLVDNPRVSHFRLTATLAWQLLIFSRRVLAGA